MSGVKTKTIGVPVDGIVPIECDNEDCKAVSASVTGDGVWPIEQGWRPLHIHALCPACAALMDAVDEEEEGDGKLEMNN